MSADMQDKRCAMNDAALGIECDKPVKARGLCKAHYRRWRLKQPLTPPVRSWRRGAVCVEAGCGRPHHANGLCVNCYRRSRYRYRRDPNVR